MRHTSQVLGRGLGGTSQVHVWYMRGTCEIQASSKAWESESKARERQGVSAPSSKNWRDNRVGGGPCSRTLTRFREPALQCCCRRLRHVLTLPGCWVGF